MRRMLIRKITIGCCLVAAGFALDGWFQGGLVVREAQARIGRPLTPVSVAGVARRTTRRCIRRSTIYLATLPTGCSTIVIEGTTLSQCGGTYYQKEGPQYVVVYVD